MPLINSNDPSVWAALYNPPYNRANKREHFGENDWMTIGLRTALGLIPNQRVVLLGAGFGFIAEEFISFGLRVAAVDTSTWIQNNKIGNIADNVTIHNMDISTNNGRNQIRNLLGTVDWVITEDILPCLSDAECTALATRCRGINANVKVAHWVSASTPSGLESWPQMNWKTGAQWKTLMSPDSIVIRGTNVVV